jgi:crotonobetainyl-CoA:carnitine CoA-transferase CaiB-like acyl-CoA transferase
VRICDFSGQLAGAGASRFLAAMGAEVIRIEDPVTKGYWDALRGMPPFVDDRRGADLGGAFNNHNVEKLGVTLNLRTAAGRALLGELVEVSDVVTENFAAGVLARLGFPYEELRRIRADVVYVSNSGFGHRGPYRDFKTWGPIVQAMCGLTFSTGLGGEPAGIGYSYMDHQGANFMAIAVLAGLMHRDRTGEGQWIDISCTDAGALLTGPAILDYTVNGRGLRGSGAPDSNRSRSPLMVPHGIYPARGDDNWIAIACRHDADWRSLAALIGTGWAADESLGELGARMEAEERIDALMAGWTRSRDRFELAARGRAAGVPATAVTRPGERIDDDAATAEWGLWPTVRHREIGEVRVEGLPVHFSKTDWAIERGAPCLGEHNEYVICDMLGHTRAELDEFRAGGVV